MKVIATISNTTDAVYHLGARMEHISYVIDIPEPLIPEDVMKFIVSKKENTPFIDTISFSLLMED